MAWSYQLYSSRNETDLAGVLSHLAGAGYSQVEGYFGVFDDPKGVRALLDQNGLSMPTAHVGLELIEKDAAAVGELAKTLGFNTVYAPFVMPEERPTDAAGWKAFAARLAKAAEAVGAEGLNFGWHNHDFEFVTLADGSTPMEHILEGAPGIEWEADVAWIVRGGADPIAWLSKYADRVTAVHVKDIAPEGECLDEDGWADVGEGVMPWGELLKLAREKTATKVFVMEHDKPSDTRRFAERSITNATKLGG